MKFNSQNGFTPQEAFLVKKAIQKNTNDIANKQDKMTAGDGILISESNKISLDFNSVNFEKINTIEIDTSGTVSSIVFNKDSDNNDLHLRRAILLVYTPANTEITGTISSYLAFKNESGVSSGNIGTNFIKYANQKICAYHEIVALGDDAFVNFSYAIIAAGQKTANNFAVPNAANFSAKEITEVSITFQSAGNYFDEGSKAVLYGIKIPQAPAPVVTNTRQKRSVKK